MRSRTLRLIGDPVTRYREDPVRMLRAVRFAAKLDFTLAPETAAPIKSLGGLLSDVPPARLFDELLKLFHSGHGAKQLRRAARLRSAAVSVPRHTARARKTPTATRSPASSAAVSTNTDERIREDKPVTPTFLYAVFLWFPISALA